MNTKVTFDSGRHGVTTERPRLLGSGDYLKKLARERPEQYRRMVEQAGGAVGAASQPASTRPRRRSGELFYDLNGRCIGLSIAYVVEGDKALGRAAVDLVLKNYVDQSIESGHVTFAHSLARCAIVYDLCHDLWTPGERARFSTYVHATIAANTKSEPSVFHNGWYGYKQWGYGMAGYALMHDDPLAGKILSDLEDAYLKLAVPALKLAGDGGAWAEGFYVHYWILEWLFFCETARICEGVDYYAAAPEFYGQRAIAAMFETFPAKGPKNSWRPIPMGDSHGRMLNHERDKELGARRILASYYRDDPDHQAVHAFNLQTPQTAFAANAYMDFLWKDDSIKPGDLDSFKLSHVGKGAGFIYARSSWKEDATHFFFKCGRRFTSHQHLDNGHFGIFKYEELLGDGGHYDSFETDHAINYYIRTVAHNSILIYDPAEIWPSKSPATPKGIRDAFPAVNDGGQYYPWSASPIGANGVALDVQQWTANKEIMEIGELAAAREHGNYFYAAGDFTRSYSPKKAKLVTRQIVFVRPGTFVVFDRVESTDAGFKKSFLLQTMKPPQQVGAAADGMWMVANGKGKLFIQCLEPGERVVELHQGEGLYTYHGHSFPPKWMDPPAPECRMEISPAKARKADYFLHVLTATDAQVQEVVAARCAVHGNDMVVTVGGMTIRFALKARK